MDHFLCDGMTEIRPSRDSLRKKYTSTFATDAWTFASLGHPKP